MRAAVATTSQTSLGPMLAHLDLRLRLAVEEQRAELAEWARDPFRGLYISDADVEALLADTPDAARARQLLLAQPPAATSPRLARLARWFGLDAVEQEALLVCLAPDIDLRYERLYAYLQDDVTRRRPTVDLILRLLVPAPHERVEARRALGPGGRLLRHGLLVLADDTAVNWPLLARPLRVDERIVEYLLGSDRPDTRIGSFTELVHVPAESEPEHGIELDRGLVRLLRSQPAPAVPGPVIYLHGAPGSGKAATARAACAAAGRALLLVNIPTLLGESKPERGLELAVREALLQDAVLGIDSFDRLLGDEPDLLLVRERLRALLAERIGSTLLLGEIRWEPALWLSGVTALRLELRAPGPGARVRLWRAHLDGQLSPEEAAQMAARYRLDVDAVRAVVSAAHSRAVWRGDTTASLEDVRHAARAIAAPPLEGLAQRVEPRYGWEDIVLPPDGLAQLRELCARARYQSLVLERWGYGRKHARRASLSALFAGQPGTGKTMAAEIVAGDLGLDLYRIDLSGVVSKYIGETEKNLERIFRAADRGDAVLLFDEADALFGKRSEVRDAHDRYANVEIAYLLQRLESYEGVAILTTNLRGNIDEAFLRRLDFVIEFPMPEEAERLAIWQRALPPEAPLADDVDLPFLARKFRLAGGHIRNIALTAAFLAAADGGPIGMKHLVRGTRREYQKLGKLVGESDFEKYHNLLRDT
jgi:SpoVK/Ycf46/Vps4 family AAA+-type ATPase